MDASGLAGAFAAGQDTLLLALCIHQEVGSRDLDLCMQAPSRGPLAGKANKLLTHIQQMGREMQEGEEADKKRS
jgi:hypothetical protein